MFGINNPASIGANHDPRDYKSIFNVKQFNRKPSTILAHNQQLQGKPNLQCSEG